MLHPAEGGQCTPPCLVRRQRFLARQPLGFHLDVKMELLIEA
jgi:hypothetical protein